jgi:glutamate-1-semialdehyde aminotransferase
MDGEFFVLSAAHTEEDIDQTVKALCDSLDAMLSLKLI